MPSTLIRSKKCSLGVLGYTTQYLNTSDGIKFTGTIFVPWKMSSYDKEVMRRAGFKSAKANPGHKSGKLVKVTVTPNPESKDRPHVAVELANELLDNIVKLFTEVIEAPAIEIEDKQPASNTPPGRHGRPDNRDNDQRRVNFTSRR